MMQCHRRSAAITSYFTRFLSKIVSDERTAGATSRNRSGRRRVIGILMQRGKHEERSHITESVVTRLLAGVAAAQTRPIDRTAHLNATVAPPNTTGPSHNPSVAATSNANDTIAPAKGSNSFTEACKRKLIASGGNAAMPTCLICVEGMTLACLARQCPAQWQRRKGLAGLAGRVAMSGETP